MNNLPTVTAMGYLVPHTLNPVKHPQARSLHTTLIPLLILWAFIARDLQTILVVNDQEDRDQAIEMCNKFYDAVQDDPDDGGETMITLMNLVM